MFSAQTWELHQHLCAEHTREMLTSAEAMLTWTKGGKAFQKIKKAIVLAILKRTPAGLHQLQCSACCLQCFLSCKVQMVYRVSSWITEPQNRFVPGLCHYSVQSNAGNKRLTHFTTEVQLGLCKHHMAKPGHSWCISLLWIPAVWSRGLFTSTRHDNS